MGARVRLRWAQILLLVSLPALRAQYTLSTQAGGWQEPVSARDASFWTAATAPDGHGNLYITTSTRLLRLNAEGTLLTVAGTGHMGDFQREGIATQIPLFLFTPALAVGPQGEVYFFESPGWLRRFDPRAGLLTTLADFSNPATLLGTSGIAVDANGSVFVAAAGRDRIFKIDPITGRMETVAGTGERGFAGDGGPATQALLGGPSAPVFDKASNLYFVDGGTRIRRISASGVITTVAGTGVGASLGDGGPAMQASIQTGSLAISASGDLYLAGFGTVRKISASTGIISVAVGNRTGVFSGDGGPASQAGLGGGLRGISFDELGNLYFTGWNHVRRVRASDQIIETIAGGGAGGDGGPAKQAHFVVGSGVTVDSARNLFIGDYEGIRRVDAANGTISSTLRNPDLAPFRRSVLDRSGNLIFIASCTIRKIDAATGITTMLSGGGGCSINTNDRYAAVGSNMAHPGALAIDRSGALYFGDVGRIRKLEAGASVVTTIAGDGQRADTGDGGSALDARVLQIDDLVVDAKGDLYISAGRIRKIDQATGIISAVVPSVNASLAIGPTGLLYFTDSLASVRKFDPVTGNVQTVAGGGRQGYSPDGSPALGARFGQLDGIAVDARGTVYVADTIDGSVRTLTPPAVVLNAVTNGASNETGPLAPGEIVVLYGSGLGPQGLVNYKLDATGRVGTEIAGARVLFNGVPGLVLYSSDRQVSAIVPYGVTGNSIEVVAEVEGRTSSAVAVPLVDTAPAIFTANSTGSGQAAAVNQDGSINSAGNPASGGSILALYATGEGLTTPSMLTGALASPPYPMPLLPVTATIGGVAARVRYAGAAPGQVAGLMQVNVEIPAGTASGNAAVSIRVGGHPSQDRVTVAIQR